MFKFVMPIKKPDPVFTFNIDIDFSLGYIANLDESTSDNNDAVWIDIDDQNKYNTYLKGVDLNHNGIFITIALDDSIIHQSTAEKTASKLVHGTAQLNQSQQTKKMILEISGYADRHMPIVNGSISARCAIKINSIKFEDIDIMRIFEKDSVFYYDQQSSIGDTIFSCNGQSVFAFETPIYKWLLNNSSLICYWM